MELNVDNIIEPAPKQFDKGGRYKKIRCQCGATISKCNIAQHKKTRRHKEIMNIINSGTLELTQPL
jgi:hypothetical protein